MKGRLRSAAVVCALTLFGPVFSADAAPLNLTQGYPDINASSNLTATYVACTDTFCVGGCVVQYAPCATEFALGIGSLTLTADIDETGQLITTGSTLTIFGAVLGYNWVLPNPPVPEDLITADLTDFGFTGSGDSTVFEFLGDVTGGYFASDFGSRVGVIFRPQTTDYDGSFDTDFSVSGTSTLDAFTGPPSNDPPIADADGSYDAYPPGHPSRTTGEVDGKVFVNDWWRLVGEDEWYVTLDGSGSTDSDGTIVSWEWDLDGDSVTDFTGETVDVSRSDLGLLGWTDYQTREITLTVTDNGGLTDDDTTNLTMIPEPATLVLLGCGGVLVAMRTRRRKTAVPIHARHA